MEFEAYSTGQHFSFQLLFVLLALLYAPMRLIEEADPDWGLVSWALAIEIVGLTLLLIYHAFGPAWMKRLAFPIAFFLVAVPWPSVLETPLIQALTRADAGATAELIGWFGVPAMAHGNVIEVATGQVGIADACSGIRSFQATLMIALFLGDFYCLNLPRRVFFVLCGFAMSLGFNLARMSVLVWVAANHGIAAIEQWHDPAGITILLACFFGLWGLGIVLARKKATVHPVAVVASPAALPPSKFRLAPLLLSLLAWIALVEVSVESWYRWHEQRLPPAKQWTIAWPTNNPTFKDSPIAAAALEILKCDENRNAGWQEDDRQWQVIFIKWNPGTHVSFGHSPNICMTGAGHTLTTVSDCEWYDAGGLRLPFAVFEVMDAPQPFYIFYCLWNDRLNTSGPGATYLSFWGNKLAPVLAGIRNPGYRSLEIAVGGVTSAGEAESAMRAELEKILVVTTTPPP